MGNGETAMTTKQSSFVWYELMTTDVAAAKAFYGSVVGWSMQDMPMPGMTYTIVSMGEAQVGGIMPIPKDAAAAGMQPCWASYIAVDDVDAGAATVQRLGGKILAPPTDIPTIGRFATVADPQGAMFNLFKPNRAGERTYSMAPGQVGWHELHARDFAKAFEFYAAMFGWTSGDAMDMGPMGTYQILKIGDVPVGAVFNSPAADKARFWLYYFNVADIDAALARLTAGGGRLMMGPVQVPGGNWIVQASDPQGAPFALVGPKR